MKLLQQHKHYQKKLFELNHEKICKYDKLEIAKLEKKIRLKKNKNINIFILV